MDPLRKLILITLGKEDSFARKLKPEDWNKILERATSQSLAGVLLSGIEKLPQDQLPPEDIYEDWKKLAQSSDIINETHRRQCAELTHIFNELGYRSCIIKGQAFARYYPLPDRRHCGDIDIWVDGDEQEILDSLHSKGYKTTLPLYQEVEVKFFPSTNVDVHFRPQKMFNPVLNARLQDFYDSQLERCLNNPSEYGYNVPTIRFDMVHCIVHLFRHMLGEYLTLHQLMDCYYMLLRSNSRERTKAYLVIKEIGLRSFCADVMYALKWFFRLESNFMLCPASGNERGTLFIKRIKGKEGRCKNTTFRHLKFLNEYPRELIWSPAHRIWQHFWRKKIK